VLGAVVRDRPGVGRVVGTGSELWCQQDGGGQRCRDDHLEQDGDDGDERVASWPRRRRGRTSARREIRPLRVYSFTSRPVMGYPDSTKKTSTPT
jgi:hypothetical protein